jgi:hypothetical protein
MINIPTPAPAKKNKTRKPKSIEPPSPDLRQLIHEMFNQLTVMNLCCFKFRGAVGRTIDLALLADVDRMEKAIADLTVLLENFPHPKTSTSIECAEPDGPSINAGAAEPQPNNVYPLFKPTLRRR